MFQSPRSIFAVNRPPQDEHLPTLNNEHYFSVPPEKKPLHSEHMHNKNMCACIKNEKKQRLFYIDDTEFH